MIHHSPAHHDELAARAEQNIRLRRENARLREALRQIAEGDYPRYLTATRVAARALSKEALP